MTNDMLIGIYNDGFSEYPIKLSGFLTDKNNSRLHFETKIYTISIVDNYFILNRNNIFDYFFPEKYYYEINHYEDEIIITAHEQTSCFACLSLYTPKFFVVTSKKN